MNTDNLFENACHITRHKYNSTSEQLNFAILEALKGNPKCFTRDGDSRNNIVKMGISGIKKVLVENAVMLAACSENVDVFDDNTKATCLNMLKFLVGNGMEGIDLLISNGVEFANSIDQVDDKSNNLNIDKSKPLDNSDKKNQQLLEANRFATNFTVGLVTAYTDYKIMKNLVRSEFISTDISSQLNRVEQFYNTEITNEIVR
ncbi:MAG: hypothetical protein RR406_03560 [Bacilli bacterium]